jgi:hypothetical protein
MGAVVEPALIVGSLEDEHVQAVVRAMSASPPMVLDASSLEDGEFLLDGNRLELSANNQRQELRLQGARGWVRRLSPPGWRGGVVGGSRDAAVRGAWVAFTVGLASHPDVDWLTPYTRLIGAENKLRQAAHAVRLGIRVPRTVVASDPAAIPVELGDELVVKPLGVGSFVRADGEARVLWAQTLRRGDDRLSALGGAPFLVQECVPACQHLRVVTLKNRVWACSLQADGLPVDWRRTEEAHHAFRPISDRAVEQAALRLAADMGLRYSSQDWIDTGDDAVFVDLNPAGQWMFLPDPVSGAVAQAIADHLSGA